jgi:uncharacterized membrane protein YfcA
MFFSNILLNLFIGTKTFPSIIGIKCGSAWNYIVQIAFILECFCITILAIHMTLKESRIKHKFNINVSPNDFKFDTKGIITLCLIGVFGGLLVGGFGVGGGIVFNPALLAIGYDAQVANATGMFMSMISNTAAIVTQYLSNNVQADYGFCLSAWSVLATFIGISSADYAVKMLKGR